MDKFAFNKALNHFNINEDEFMGIYNKYLYHQITIEEHYAKEKVMPEIEKWLSENEDNSIIMKFKHSINCNHLDGSMDEYNEIQVTISYRKEICYAPDLSYEYAEKHVYLEEHEIDFENVAKLIFEDERGNKVKQLIN